MKKIFGAFYTIAATIAAGVVLFAGQGMAADVDVYAEGAYTNSDLVLFIYADINGSAILSAGVKVTYPTSLTVTSATKNASVWFMGGNAYMEPETSTAGEVVMILGKLDPAAPTAGVSGTRVLMGKIVFSHSGATMPPAITMDYGRTGDYDNFVATDGTVMDGSGVAFTGVAIYERGDANGDGSINVQDMAAVKYYMTNGGDANPWKDCNGDGAINVQDMACVRFEMTN